MWGFAWLGRRKSHLDCGGGRDGGHVRPERAGETGWDGYGRGSNADCDGPVSCLRHGDAATERPKRVQEDMAIMIEGALSPRFRGHLTLSGVGTDGRYYFQAGSICTAGVSTTMFFS